MSYIATKKIHKTAGTIALLTILAFFLSSFFAELNGNLEVIKSVKTGILYGIILLFIVMPATVITGRKLARNHTTTTLARKKSRMKLIAINAIVLIGLAITLCYRAINNLIDRTFVAIQIIEFVFGLSNAILLGLMIRDGKQLSTEIEIGINKNI
jgi:hypothetical protein